MSGATNEVALLKTGLWFREPVLTPQADDLHPVLGPVVTAQRYPITSCSKVTDRRSGRLLAYKNASLTSQLSRGASRLTRRRLQLMLGSWWPRQSGCVFCGVRCLGRKRDDLATTLCLASPCSFHDLLHVVVGFPRKRLARGTNFVDNRIR